MGRNFLLVSHADCVGACLTLIPGAGNIEKVHFGGHFVAFQNNKDLEAEDKMKQKPVKELFFVEIDHQQKLPAGSGTVPVFIATFHMNELWLTW